MLLLTLLGGLILLAVGGDVLVRGAVAIAQRLGVSPLLIGLTLVGFGTSTPELVTSVQAALAGSPGIAVGNVVGSNTANVLLILGVAAVIAPFAVHKESFARDGAALLGSAVLLVIACLIGTVSAVGGLVFLAGLAAYLIFSIRSERGGQVAGEADAAPTERRLGAPLAALLVLAGIAATILGARLLVSAATEIARGVGVSEAMIGLTIVAVGTSLPELVTSVVAAVRRQSDIAFGNVVGSNVFNVLFIMGATALIRPLAVPEQIARVDVWVMLAATVVLAAMAVTGWRISRREGAALLGAYGAYLAWLAWSSF